MTVLRSFLVVVTLLACLPLSRAAGSSGEDAPTAGSHGPYLGVLSAYVENDYFVDDDQQYTSGLGFSWTSDDVSRYDEKNFLRRVVRAFSFLPKLGDEGYRGFLSFTLGQEMYTPEDLEAVPPPPDQQPYAGLLFLDTTIDALGERSMHSFTIRVGCVGPCSGAEEVQKWAHEWNPAPTPQGWGFQLDNEPLLNVNYQYYRRIHRRTPPHGLQYDLATDVGGGLGNYFIGATGGIIGRVGFHLPDNYSISNLRFGGGSWLVGLYPPRGSHWHGYAFLGVEGMAVGRFLPTDGNTFEDSPSVDREDLFGNVSSGLVIGYRRFLFSWTLTNLRGLTDPFRSGTNDYGTLTLSWYFGGRSR